MPCVSYNFDFLISVQSGPVAQFWPTQTGRSLGLEFSPRLRTTNAGSFPLHSALRMSILTYSPAQKREEESPQATRETSLKPRRIPAACLICYRTSPYPSPRNCAWSVSEKGGGGKTEAAL